MDAESLDIAIKHVIATLPQQIHVRRQLLKAIVRLIPDNYPARQEITDMLTHLEHHEILQQEFPSLITNRRKESLS